MRFILPLLLIAGCAKVAAPILPTYRDLSVPIASKADFDPVRFAGTWYEVARYPTPVQFGCPRARVDYGLPDTTGALTVRNACVTGSGTIGREIAGRARLIGPGRLDVALDGVPGTAPLWVLWIDEGYRTAVLGQPDGKAGWIINRELSIPADRLTAAREVLAFNGYDLTALNSSVQ